MAKKAKPTAAATSEAGGAFPGYVDIVRSNELWSEFTLADGAVLRLKPSLIEVRRRPGEFSADGNPIYDINAGLLIGVRAPEGLRESPKPKRGRKE